MCKTCEFKVIDMRLIPLVMDEEQKTIELPKSLQELEGRNFHEDLLLRAYAHLAWTRRKYGTDCREYKNARAFLSALGKGFAEPFDRSLFPVETGDPYFELKTNALNAIEELSLEFGDRVSSVMWDALAHLATRSEPEEKKSILKEADSLPHHYGVIDTCLHAFGKVYSFSLHCQSTFYRHTKMVLIHNCDCDCSLLNLQPVSGSIIFKLTEEQRFEATQSLFTHMCAESELILNQKLPFEYTITKEAQELLGLQ